MIKDFIPVEKGIVIGKEKALLTLNISNAGKVKKADHAADNVRLGHLIGI